MRPCSRRWPGESAGRGRDPGERAGKQRPAARRAGRTGRTGPGGEGEDGPRRAARADRPDPGRAADLAAGHRLAAQGRRRRGDPGRVHRAADDRRLHRLPAPAVPAGLDRAMLPAHNPPMPGRHQARPRRPAVLVAASSPSCARLIRLSRTHVPAAAPPWTRTRWATSASATTRPPPPGSSTTGCAAGPTATTPATRWAAGCASTRSRSSCSPATSPRTGRPTSPSAAPKPPKRHQAVSGYWHPPDHPRPVVPHPQLP